MNGRFAWASALAALLSATAAHAGMIGDKVDGTVTFDPYGTDSVADWAASPATINSGLEFFASDSGEQARANFRDKLLVIRDRERIKETSSGWEMTFKLLSPNEFKKMSLVNSNFGPNLTYSLKNHVLTIAWTGDQAYAAMTPKERRENGDEKFRAVFKITSGDPPVAVPEPGALGLLGSGLFAAAAFGVRRRKAAAS
jgi:PEP-CTERM motif